MLPDRSFIENLESHDPGKTGEFEMSASGHFGAFGTISPGFIPAFSSAFPRDIFVLTRGLFLAARVARRGLDCNKLKAGEAAHVQLE